MRKRDYDAALFQIDKEVSRLAGVKHELIRQFKLACPHKEQDLRIETNWYDDEYGRTLESSTDYDYHCSRCGTKVRNVKKMFANINELRAALKQENGA